MMHRLLETLGVSYFDESPGTGVSAEDVRNAYWLLFGRVPENKEVIEHHRQQNSDVWSLLRGLIRTAEFANRAHDFTEPRTTLDWRALRASFEQPAAPTRPGYVTDFLGLHTDVSYLCRGTQHEGRIDGLPVAGDTQCSTAEWTAGLRGVELGRPDFVAVELGAGWGAWMAILCRAAQIRGVRSTFAVGCEADSLHCRMLERHLAANGFSTRQYRLHEGAVAGRRGVALFPVCQDSSQDWGLRPIFCRSEAEAAAILADPARGSDYRGFEFERFERVACFTLEELLTGVDHVDVLHMDVQGSELELVEQNLDLLRRRVGYLIVGTHARQIEGQLIALLTAAGWQLEVEEACSFELDSPRYAPRVDGVQGWRNMQIHP